MKNKSYLLKTVWLHFLNIYSSQTDNEGDDEEEARHISVENLETGVRLTGEDAPLSSEVDSWLLANPGCVVLNFVPSMSGCFVSVEVSLQRVFICKPLCVLILLQLHCDPRW